MHRNCTNFSFKFKIYQLKCAIERCNFQDLDRLECSNPTHVNLGHSRYPSDELVEFSWAKIVFSCWAQLRNHHPLSLCLLQSSTIELESRYFLSERLFFTPTYRPISFPITPHQQRIVTFCLSPWLAGTNANQTWQHPDRRIPAWFLLLFVDFWIQWRMKLLWWTPKGRGWVRMNLCH